MEAPPVLPAATASSAPPVLTVPKAAWRWLVMLVVLASYPLLIFQLPQQLPKLLALFGYQVHPVEEHGALLPGETGELLKVCALNFGFFVLLFVTGWLFARPSLDELWARWRRPWITFGLAAAWSVGLRVGVGVGVGGVIGGVLLWQLLQGARVNVSHGERKAELTAFSVGTHYVSHHAWTLRSGSNLSPADIRHTNRVCLLGFRSAQKLFGDQVDPVGGKLQFNGETFTVTGWLASSGPATSRPNPDELLLVPSSFRLTSLEKFRPKTENLLDFEALRNPVYLFTVVTLVSFVVAGLREELWRAGMMTALLALLPERWRNWRGQVVAITFAAIIFGLGHLPQGAAGVVITGLLGLGLGGVMTFHRSLWVAVLAHGFFDATSFILIWVLERSGLLKQLIPG